MNEPEYLYTSTFNSLDECTEYYYNELGKLSQAPEISERQRKKLRKWIVNSMYECIQLLIKQQRQANEISKTVQNENYAEFKQARKAKKPPLLKRLFFGKRQSIEVLSGPENSSKALENGNEVLKIDKNLNAEENGNLADNHSQTKGEQSSTSCDDLPMTF